MSNYFTYQEGLIKTLLVDTSAITDVVRIVSVDDFEDEKFKAVYQGMIDLESQGKAINLPDILKHIQNEDLNILPDWILNLNSNTGNYIRKGPATTWANFVKNEAAKHKAVQLIEQKKEELLKTNSKAIDAIGSLTSELSELSIKATDNHLMSPKESADDYIKYLEDKENLKVEPIKSAYPSVDKHTGGWKPGDMITVGGATGSGKSIIAVNTAMAAAAAGKSVLFFSLEMRKNELWERMISMKAQLNSRDLDEGLLSDEDKKLQLEANEFLSSVPIIIDDSEEVTVDYIRSTAIKQSRSVFGLDMIIIDYLQLISPSFQNKNRSRHEEVADISKKIKILAKKLEVPIMVLVQLNRKTKEEDEERLPTLNDVRESAQIAFDSDIVLILHRPDKSKNILDEKAMFILDKNRRGPAGKKLFMRCLLEYSTFQDLGALKYNNDEEQGEQSDLESNPFSSYDEYDYENVNDDDLFGTGDDFDNTSF